MSCVFSVIIPVHNTEQYLPFCIESVLNQSFPDFELLLIDDGSSDRSGLICDEFADEDSRIRVIHQENGGVCSARNKGIEVSRGQFIVFIDADDYIDNHHLNHLLSSDSDLVLTGVQKFGANSNGIIPQKTSSFTIDELPYYWNTPPRMNYLYCFSCSKRFRGDVIRNNGIRFNESLFFSEDLCFNMSYYSFANSFTELPFADYMYRIESISRDEKFKMNASQLIQHYEQLDSCFQQLYDRIGKESLSFVQDNTNLRLMRKFYYYLMQDSIDFSTFVQNIRSFRDRDWAGYMMRLLRGRKEKRVMREACRFPLLAYCLEVRLQRAIGRFLHHRFV